MTKEANLAIVKWAGGKRQLLSKYEEFFPDKIERYFEPFVGGGSVALYILKTRQPKQVFLSEINGELINLYWIVRDSSEDLINLFKKYKKRHSIEGKEFYLKVRKQDPDIMSQLSRAARFLYLNRTCFNGLYRVNSKGQFNVPMGKYKNPGICPENDLRAISKILRGVELKNQSYEQLLSEVRKGDFVYLDPPYYPLNKASFTKYAKGDFLEEEQKKLKKFVDKLSEKGVKVMLSNSDADFIKELYWRYNLHEVEARRNINSDASKRGKIKELVITNY